MFWGCTKCIMLWPVGVVEEILDSMITLEPSDLDDLFAR